MQNYGTQYPNTGYPAGQPYQPQQAAPYPGSYQQPPPQQGMPHPGQPTAPQQHQQVGAQPGPSTGGAVPYPLNYCPPGQPGQGGADDNYQLPPNGMLCVVATNHFVSS